MNAKKCLSLTSALSQKERGSGERSETDKRVIINNYSAKSRGIPSDT